MTLNKQQQSTSIKRQTTRLGALIRTARKQHSLTQSQLADRIGVTIPTLRRLESGEGSVSLHTFLAGLSLLNIEDDVLHYPIERSSRPVLKIPSNEKQKYASRLQANGINSRDAENAAWILSLSGQQRVQLLKNQEKEQKLCGIALR